MATQDRDPPDDDSVLAEMAAAVATPAGAGWQGGAKAEDRYEVGELLGKGGMAVVHRARDRVLGRAVALKFVRDASPLTMLRLEREARALARVEHPNICPIYDVGELDGKPFIAMPCIEGRPLGEAELSLADKARVMRDVARAVHAAHQAGLVHRDLKPANILVERSEEGALTPYVMDFGIAREADDRTLTLTGQMLGTPMYMAPEQADGRRDDIDARTDVWALGATLYQLLAGAPPFPAESVPQLLLQISAADPSPIRRRAPDTPVALETIAMRCLRRDPAARYPSAAALADDLDRYLADQPIAARPASLIERARTRLRRHPARSAAVAALVLGAGGGAAFFLVGRDAPPATWRPVVQDVPPFFDENSNGIAISPDGTQMVYDSDRDGDWRVYLAPIEGGRDRVISPPGVAGLTPSFTRDGRAVLYATDREEIMRQPLDGGPAVRVTQGAIDAVDCGRGLLLLRIDSSAECAACRRITLRMPDGDERDVVRFDRLQGVYGLDCDRDGRRAVFGGRSRGVAGRVTLVDLEGGEPVVLADDQARTDRVRFHPDGRSVLFASARGGTRNLWEQPLAGGPARQITFGGGPDVTAAVTPDGRRLVYDVDVSFAPVFAQRLDGGPPRRLSAALEYVEWLDLAPDGRELVLEAVRDDVHQVAILSVESGDERVLAEGSRPIFSEDGAEVLYVSEGRLFAVPRAGGAPEVRAIVPALEATFGGSDGVYLLSFPDGRPRAWRIPYHGGAAEEITQPAPWLAHLSLPAGWRALWGPEKGFVLLPPGVEPGQPGAKAIGQAYFGVNARTVIYLLGNEIHTVDLASGEDRTAGPLPQLVRSLSGLSPDGITFYFSATRGQVRRQAVTNFADRPR